MTEVAAVRGVAGTVINGVCRDVSASLSQHYPLFSRGRVMRTGKDRSMVDLSDHGNLLERFVALPLPRMFMYGHQNNSLPYVTRLAENGIELAEISTSRTFRCTPTHRRCGLASRISSSEAAKETTTATPCPDAERLRAPRPGPPAARAAGGPQQLVRAVNDGGLRTPSEWATR
jgi:hypothetical protein